MRDARDNQWTLGIIRRLKRDESHGGHVGIQSLSKTLFPVQLRCLDEEILTMLAHADPVKKSKKKEPDNAAFVDRGADIVWAGEAIDVGTLDKLLPKNEKWKDETNKVKLAAEKINKNSFTDSDEKGFTPSLLLSATPDDKGEISLLVKAGIFFEDKRFQMLVMDKPYALRSTTLIERGEDYDLAKFRILD